MIYGHTLGQSQSLNQLEDRLKPPRREQPPSTEQPFFAAYQENAIPRKTEVSNKKPEKVTAKPKKQKVEQKPNNSRYLLMMRGGE